MGTRFNITDAKGKKRTHQRSWQEVNEKAGRLNDTKLALIEMTCGGSSRYLEMTGDQSWFDCEQVRSGDNLAGRKRGQDVISSVLYHRGSSLDEKKKNFQETRKKFHLANPRYPYSTFGKRNVRFLRDKISHRCRYQMSNLLSRKTMYPSNPLFRCSQKRTVLRLLFSILVSFPRSRNDRQLTKLSSYQIDSVTRRER